MSFELIGLHDVDRRHILLFSHIVLIHVEEDISNLLHHLLLHVPNSSDLDQELVVRDLGYQSFRDWV
mgnify:CR=1 FL=1